LTRSDLRPHYTPEQVDIAREAGNELTMTLETERRQLETLVEHLPDGVLLLDGERRILLSNPAAQTYLPVLTDVATGSALTHLAGRPMEELLRPPPKGLWHELQVAGPPRRAFEVVARPVAAGVEAEGWVLVVRDVTEEQNARQPAQQQERLAAIGRLVGGVAHDLNNLITTIILYAQMGLSKRDLPPELKQVFETILSESQQATQLMQQILDFSRRPPVKTQSEMRREKPASTTPATGRGETILLAEDSERVRKVGRRILESLGYRVLTAADGREAMEIYRSAEEVDLVITDVVMPEMGGMELVRELKKVNPHLKALAVTGYTLIEAPEELKENGILDIVHKPFDTETLAETIRRTLDADLDAC